MGASGIAIELPQGRSAALRPETHPVSERLAAGVLPPSVSLGKRARGQPSHETNEVARARISGASADRVARETGQQAGRRSRRQWAEAQEGRMKTPRMEKPPRRAMTKADLLACEAMWTGHPQRSSRECAECDPLAAIRVAGDDLLRGHAGWCVNSSRCLSSSTGRRACAGPGLKRERAPSDSSTC